MVNISNLAIVLHNIIYSALWKIISIKKKFRQFTNILADTHDIYTLSVLGNTYVMRTEDNRFAKDVVTDSHKVLVYHTPSISLVMGCEVANVLQQGIFRVCLSHNTLYIEKESSLCFILET